MVFWYSTTRWLTSRPFYSWNLSASKIITGIQGIFRKCGLHWIIIVIWVNNGRACLDTGHRIPNITQGWCNYIHSIGKHSRPNNASPTTSKFKLFRTKKFQRQTWHSSKAWDEKESNYTKLCSQIFVRTLTFFLLIEMLYYY